MVTMTSTLRLSTVPSGRGLSASPPRHFVPGYYQPVPPGQNNKLPQILLIFAPAPQSSVLLTPDSCLLVLVIRATAARAVGQPFPVLDRKCDSLHATAARKCLLARARKHGRHTSAQVLGPSLRDETAGPARALRPRMLGSHSGLFPPGAWSRKVNRRYHRANAGHAIRG